MANEYAVNRADLAAVADAIREKGGSNDALAFPDGFVDAVGAIRAESGDADEQFAAFVNGTLTELNSTAITKVADHAFYKCAYLEKINLPNCTHVGTAAFHSFAGAQDVLDFPSCTHVAGDAFQAAKSVKEVRFESLVENINMFNNFANMSSLETVYMPNCIHTPDFRNSPNLKNLTFSPNIERLQGYSFYKTGIEEAIFPTVPYVFNNVFRDCPNLTKVDINNSSHYVEGNLCQNAAVLETFIMRSTNFCRLGATTAFAGTPIESGTGYIYVPSALVEEYKAATNWAVYADQIRAIEDYPEITGG